MKNLVGQQIGNYRLTRLLAHGGFAEVYLGQHVRLSMPAAIKILPTHLSEENTANFQREAQIIASLVHPHIVRVLDFDVVKGVPFLVLDFAPNGSLRQRHPREERVPLSTIVHYVNQIASALQYAHDRKLIHRDIKPENMLLGRQDELLLTDFGIATIAHATSSMSAQASMGTIPYMAPEQIRELPRPASDQYSLGVAVYTWLCGEFPFQGSFTEIAAKHMMIPAPSLREKVPGISYEVESIVLTALAKDPKQRFANVMEFAEALERASRTRSSLIIQAPQKAPPISEPLEMPARLPPTFPPLTPFIPSSMQEQVLLDHMPLSAHERMAEGFSGMHEAVQTPAPSMPLVPPPEQRLPFPDIPIEHLPTSIALVPAHPRFSRRKVLMSIIAGTAMTVAGSGFAWWIVSSRPVASAEAYIYGRHMYAVLAVSWSLDGQRIASGGNDKTIQVWNANGGGHLFTYRGHTSYVEAVAWSPDGRRVASASHDKTVQVWDATDGGHIFTYRGHSDVVWSLVWSPDGERIASASHDRSVHVWDAKNGDNSYTYRGHTAPVRAASWSPDGKHIASCSWDETVQIWDAEDGKPVYKYKGHTDIVRSVVWSPDGQHIASGGDDKTVQVWNAADGEHILTYQGHTNNVQSLAWSPDGQRIASGGDDKTVQVWHAIDGGNVYTYQGHTDIVNAVAWSPDGKSIASSSDDRTVQIWSVGA